MPGSEGSMSLFLVGKIFSISDMHCLACRKFKNKMPIFQKWKLSMSSIIYVDRNIVILKMNI